MEKVFAGDYAWVRLVLIAFAVSTSACDPNGNESTQRAQSIGGGLPAGANSANAQPIPIPPPAPLPPLLPPLLPPPLPPLPPGPVGPLNPATTKLMFLNAPLVQSTTACGQLALQLQTLQGQAFAAPANVALTLNSNS